MANITQTLDYKSSSEELGQPRKPVTQTTRSSFDGTYISPEIY